MKIKKQVTPEGFIQMHIYMVRGMDEQFTVSQRDSDGNLVPFEKGDTVVVSFKDKADGKVLFEKIVTEFTDEGKAIVKIDHDDTFSLPFGAYVYDIVKINSDNVYKPLIYHSYFNVCLKV